MIAIGGTVAVQVRRIYFVGLLALHKNADDAISQEKRQSEAVTFDQSNHRMACYFSLATLVLCVAQSVASGASTFDLHAKPIIVPRSLPEAQGPNIVHALISRELPQT